jgi:serine/threonine-protein kinase PknG
MEAALRSLARDTNDLKERVDLVNQANAVRNWSLT